MESYNDMLKTAMWDIRIKNDRQIVTFALTVHMRIKYPVMDSKHTQILDDAHSTLSLYLRDTMRAHLKETGRANIYKE